MGPPSRFNFGDDRDRDGKGKGKGKGGGPTGQFQGTGDWKAEPDEGWLRDRMETRRSARFGEFSIFPRSPTPKREAPAAAAAPDAEEQQQVELTQEEKERNAKFQGGLKTALKEEAKQFQKKDKKDGDEKKDKKD